MMNVFGLSDRKISISKNLVPLYALENITQARQSTYDHTLMTVIEIFGLKAIHARWTTVISGWFTAVMASTSSRIFVPCFPVRIDNFILSIVNHAVLPIPSW